MFMRAVITIRTYERVQMSTNKVGVKYKAAGGQTLVNQGEKQVKFKNGSQIASMYFQAMNELTKPLASAARIVAKDNTIFMRGPTKSSYIENDAIGVRTPSHIQNGGVRYERGLDGGKYF